MVDALFDAALQSEGFAGTENDGHDLTSLEDGLDTDRESHLGDLLEIVAKETRVCQDSVVGERLDAGARGEAGAGLVEGNVAVLTNPGEEEVDATSTLDLGLVLDTLSLEVGCVAVEDVDVARVDVNVLEKVLPHKTVVAFWVVPWDPNIFVL